MTLEQAFKFVEVKEAGKHSAACFLEALSGSIYRSKRKELIKEIQGPHRREQGTRTQMKFVNIAARGSMEGVHHHECGGRNAHAQHMITNATDVAVTTTLNRCAGASLLAGG